MKYFSIGLFIFIFCLTLALGQIQRQPGCPKWLRPIPEEDKKPDDMNLGIEGILLLLLGAIVGLVIHFQT